LIPVICHALKEAQLHLQRSSDQSQDVNLAYDLGANSYVVKPGSITGYSNIVEKLRDYWMEINHPPEYAFKAA
jgi:hypothetical protein